MLHLSPKKKELSAKDSGLILRPKNPNDFIYTDSEYERALFELMNNKFNVLLIGGKGIGKSAIVESLAAKANFVVGYFSVPNTDPFSDIAGIPIPDIASGTVTTAYNVLLDQYDLIMFDEFNRVQHPKMQGAFLELLREKSINGRKLKRLKAVWGAINPPNEDYIVDDLDPAVRDRFHSFITLPNYPNVKYFIARYGEQLAAALIEWWNALAIDQKKEISPRRLEYIADVAISFDCNPAIVKTTVYPGMINATNMEMLIQKIITIIKEGRYKKRRSQEILDSMISISNERNGVSAPQEEEE